MPLTPKKIDILKDKHLALLLWEKRASKMLESSDKESDYQAAVQKITQIAGELFLMSRTSEEDGQRWGWWE